MYVSNQLTFQFFAYFQSQCHSASSGTGQCMFDLSCRLSYGQKVADCGGFYQVLVQLVKSECKPFQLYPV